MDLYAYMLSQDKNVQHYINEHYGPVPRPRGIRFMRYEEPDNCRDNDLWAEMCGKDVIYIHTRCGGGYDETDPDSNYIACGGKSWEEANADTFLESVDDEYDSTYRDHYFSAVIDDDYNKICELIENGEAADD